MNKILLFAGALLAMGCAHHPAPTDQVAKSIAAVRGAQEAGASEVPEAALHVKLAEEQVELAKALMADDENEAAEGKALRATQDAELAVLLARRSAAQSKLAQYEQANLGAGGESPAPSAPTGATP